MLDMLFEIASTLFMATLAGFFIWFVLSDGNPIEHFKRRLNRNKPCLCDRCVFLNQKFGASESGYHYICRRSDKDEGYINPPEYCNDFEERSNNDPHMDT
jgi:hypothetical protein|nr:MAG TPA: hypothetical protein [Caudoviricetes sp.]DAY08363.1 MAG TPA: hypothetical protein [Caudoviricetes sp.]